MTCRSKLTITSGACLALVIRPRLSHPEDNSTLAPAGPQIMVQLGRDDQFTKLNFPDGIKRGRGL
jgi:hypothetical protein